jgi:hypothetical protein
MRTISRTIVCDHLQPIVGWLFKQSQNSIIDEDRADWSYLDHLSLVARFQNRAIWCDWDFTNKQVDVTGVSTVSLTDSFPEIL